MDNRRHIALTIIRTTLAIGLVCYALIAVIFYLLPHFPITGKEQFQSRLRMQMTIDQWEEFQQEEKEMLLVLGSSVAERGINEKTLDSILMPFKMRASNSSSSGMFANANAAHLRTLLASGVRPKVVVYGFFIHDLNGASVIHNTIIDTEAVQEGLKEKSLWNVIRFGPRSLSNMLDPVTMHVYLYTVNNAFREYDQLNAFQKFAMGKIEVEIGSHYRYETKYLEDLRSMYTICREHHIPFALFNSPLRPTIASENDLPYEHRAESYQRMQEFASSEHIPIWNADTPGLFVDTDFEDTYHLNAGGARKLSRYIGEQIASWLFPK